MVILKVFLLVIKTSVFSCVLICLPKKKASRLRAKEASC